VVIPNLTTHPLLLLQQDLRLLQLLVEVDVGPRQDPLGLQLLTPLLRINLDSGGVDRHVGHPHFSLHFLDRGLRSQEGLRPSLSGPLQGGTTAPTSSRAATAAVEGEVQGS
jgi:hypothetical protein